MRKTAAILSILCLVVGFAASGLLLARTFSLLENVNASGDTCAQFFGQGCDPILLDAASYVAGLPLAGWGIIYFGTLLLLMVLGVCFDEPFHRATCVLIRAILLGGALASLWLLTRLASGELAVCRSA
jgi:uncharacterized membrane protein